MNEQELAAAAHRYQSTGPRHGVVELLRELDRRKPTLAAKEGLLIVRYLCAVGDQWRRAFRDRLKHRGGCPSRFRADLSDILHAADAAHARTVPVEIEDLIRASREPKSKQELIIERADTLGIFPGHRYLIARLQDLEHSPTPVELTIHFRCDRVYVYGLAMIAAWCARNAARVFVDAEDARVMDYLHQIGFVNVLEFKKSLEAPLYDAYNHVALTQVRSEEIDRADAVAGRIADLFQRHVGLTKDQHTALKITLAELVENVYRHANTPHPAYVLAQAHPNKRKMHLVICDTGIGVYDSFRQSDDPTVRQEAVSEAKALEMAVEKLKTSKVSRHSGYGLYVVSELAVRNGGRFRISSGKTSLLMYRDTRRGPRTETLDHLQWKGCEVAVLFELDNDLPLLEVYNDLGPPSDAEDFFTAG